MAFLQTTTSNKSGDFTGYFEAGVVKVEDKFGDG